MRLRAPLFSLLLALTACGGTDPTPARESRAELGSEHTAALEGLSAEARQTVLGSSVRPLLLPREHAAASLITAGPRWVAISARGEGITLSLHATDHHHSVVGDEELAQVPPPSATVRGEAARVTSNEGIRSVAWMEQGVAYALEVECERPFEDTRCTEDAFLLELADRLVSLEGR
jgi:hypothetical protein